MTEAGAPASTIHATAFLFGDAGVLVRGASGSGKSTLARRLLERADREGRFGRLVADDRVMLAATAGRLVARPVPEIAGLLEIRGLGIVRAPFEPACVLRLVVDLCRADPPRLPEGPDRSVDLHGVTLPRLRARLDGAAGLVAWQLRGPNDTNVTNS